MRSETFLFTDDGKIPNNKLPLLLYRHAFRKLDTAKAMEEKFALNHWTNSWRNGIYSFHHYHSNTHEVLGIYKGQALLQLGGARGQRVKVEQGDVMIIPAGVGHKLLEEKGLGVVGAYPDGAEPDLMKGEAGERPGADRRIALVPKPENDPLLGAHGLVLIW